MNPHFERIERATRELLLGLSLDLETPGLKGTPGRVAKAWVELLGGYQEDPKDILARDFPADGYDEIVILDGIDFCSFCEHHLLPFQGIATVAYLPAEGEGAMVVGVSKLARLVDCFARRLQIQERMTVQISDALSEHLKPRGAAVILRARHECLGCRGAKKAGARMITSSMTGKFRENPAARAEVFALIGGTR